MLMVISEMAAYIAGGADKAEAWLEVLGPITAELCRERDERKAACG